MAGEDHVATARAVYDMTAPAYVQFVGTEISSATKGPIDQSLLVVFVELVKGQAIHRVVDVGCGPGRAAAFVAARGLDVVGVDVSQAMLSVARAHIRISSSRRASSMLFHSKGESSGVPCAGTRSSTHHPVASPKLSPN